MPACLCSSTAQFPPRAYQFESFNVIQLNSVLILERSSILFPVKLKLDFYPMWR